MPAEDDETVTGLLALLGARLAPSDDVSANVVLAAQAAKARMQGSDSDGKAFTDVMEIKSDSRRFTFRANAYGNYARFGRTYTPEQLRQHREFLAKEEQEQQQEKARQAAEREARRQDKAEKQQQEKARQEAEREARQAAEREAREAARREERKEQEARQEAREAARRKKQKARQEGRADNTTGFVGVYLDQRGLAKPYLAKVSRGGKTVALGSFATAEEAALRVARSPEGQAAAAVPAPPMTSDEARQLAVAEELTMRRAHNTTGYFGVSINKPGQPKPYVAKVRRGPKYVNLGTFATAEEASLCVARSPEGRAAAAVTPPPPRT
jgi:chemotaxis protein histidine kinase CheA